jgi:hypothetical protein
MAHNAEEWRRLRSEFIEAAAKYDEYETFIERNAQSEDWYYNNGRYLPVGLIRWPYKPYRKCWILAGANEEPFSTMKTLFSKAWLWLPRAVADEVLDTAETHLSEPPSPPSDWGLYWAKSNYQYWCWLIWFHWLRQRRRTDPTEAERPSRKMVLAPFHCSADLIAQWGLDGSDGTIPEWLADPVIDRKYLGITLGDREASRIVNGEALTTKFERKVKPWEMFRELYHAGHDGLSKEVIAKRLWPPDGIISDNNLDQHKSRANDLLVQIQLEISPDNRGVWRLAELNS